MTVTDSERLAERLAADAIALQRRIVGEGPTALRRQGVRLTLAGAAAAVGIQLVAHVAADAIAGPWLGLPLAVVLGWLLHRAQQAEQQRQGGGADGE